MSDMSKQARSDMKAKAQRMTSADPHQKVDASSWTPPEDLKAETKTGMRPLSRRQFRRGGKVHGEAKHHPGRKPRASGGMTADDYQNRNAKVANEARPEGKDHIGGYKHGGRPHKATGGNMTSMALPQAFTPVARKSGGKVHDDAAADKKLIHAEMAKHAKGCACKMCSGGRAHKARGGITVTGMPRSPVRGNELAAIHAKDQKRIKAGMKYRKGGSVTDGEMEGTRPTGGRLAKKAGGRAHKADGGPDYGTARTGNLRAAFDAASKAPRGSVGDKFKGKIAQELTQRPPFTGRLRESTGMGAPDYNAEQNHVRTPRKAGGRAKGKTNINIIIAQPKPAMPPMPMGAAPSGPPPAPAPRPMMPPQGAAPPMPPPGAGAPPPMMGRKHGGRAYPIDAGAGGARARLEKAARA